LFKRNPNYWQSGKPYLDELQFNITADPQTSVLQLEAGSVDVILHPSWRDYARLAKDASYRTLIDRATGSYYIIAFNTREGPLADKRVRQAIAWSIDRQRYLDTVLLGQSENRQLPWPKDGPGFEAAKNSAYSYDLDKAKALLAQTGLSNITFDINYVDTNVEPRAIAEILQADLNKIGVTMNLKTWEGAVFNTNLNAFKLQGAVSRFSGGSKNPALLLNTGTYQRVKNGNFSGIDDPRYAQIVSTLTTETNPTRLKQGFSEWNDYMVDSAHVLGLASNPGKIAFRAAVNGLSFSPHEAVDWTSAWIA